MLARFLTRAARVPTVAAGVSASSLPFAAVRTFSLHPAHVRLFSRTTQTHTDATSTAAPVQSASTDAAVAQTSASHIDNFDISEPIKAALRQNFKIENLFPIQAECYNPIVSGQDVIGRSKTGQRDNTHAASTLLFLPVPNGKPPFTNFSS